MLRSPTLVTWAAIIAVIAACDGEVPGRYVPRPRPSPPSSDAGVNDEPSKPAPTPRPPAPPTTNAGGDIAGGATGPSGERGCGDAVESKELELTNETRKIFGQRPLKCDDGLARAARLHSRDMCERGYFSHTSQDGRTHQERIAAQGVRFGSAGENIAWGQRSPDEVHITWMFSPGHAAAILNAGFSRIGIGHVECDGKPYWTQNFAD